MNTTQTQQSDEVYTYSTYILLALFFLSEIMPFIRKHKGNGVVDTMVCLLKGSSCITGTIAEAIEKKDDQV